MSDYKLGVIGGGNMAQAIIGAAVNSGFLQPSEILIAEPVDTRRVELAGMLGVDCVSDNALAAACEKVLLAVKPQMMAEVLAGVAGSLHDDTLVITIAAGLPTSFFDDALAGKGRIVRVMPNTPMLAGQGASAVCSGPRATSDDIDWTKKLLVSGGGIVVDVQEDQIDAVTAVSGSGPAYFFYMLEAMVEAGVAEGLSSEVATQLAVQTCLGAAALQQQTAEDPAELRRKVTSPGGTTQRAIETLDAADVKANMVKAFRACAERSRELAK